MAQLTAHVNSSIVRSALGASTNVWRLLIIHANVNMWSRYKPTRYNGGNRSNYWKGSDNYCGFQFPLLVSGSFTPTNWTYLKPRGRKTYYEPMRAGDFRYYDHDQTLKPPFYSFTGAGGNVIPTHLDPVESNLIE